MTLTYNAERAASANTRFFLARNSWKIDQEHFADVLQST